MEPSQTEAEYLKLLDGQREYLKQIIESPEPWKDEASNKDVVIRSRLDQKTGLKIIRAETKIRAPKEQVVKIAEEIEVILEWDKTLEDLKVLHQSKDYYILYTLIKKIPLIVQREVILLARFFYEDDGTILGASCSIDHPDVEKSEYKVRCKAYLVGWVLKADPKDPNVTDFTLIMHMSPEGWIPNAVFNWFAYGQGYNIKPFGDYVEKRWKESLEKKEDKGEKKVKETEELQNNPSQS